MKKVSLLLMFFIIASSVLANKAELDALVGQIKESISDVEGNKSTYKQELSSKAMGVLLYTLIETDKKGKSTTYSYEFNLADVDPYTVREETNRDLITVTLAIANKQKLVKTTEDGEPADFENEVVILAKDVDNARKLSGLIRESIPLAKDINEMRLDLDTYEDMVSWLKENVSDVRVGGKQFEQQLESGEYEGSLVFTRVTADEKSSEKEWYTFNMADINPNSVNFDISGDQMGVHIETLRDQKVIRYKEDEEEKAFQNELTIITEDVEQARDLRTVLSLAVPASEDQIMSSMPEYSSEAEALAGVSGFVGQVSYGDNDISQTIDKACVTKFTLLDTDTKGTEEYQYSFNLMDINPNVLEYQTSGEKMYLTLVTNDEAKLIKAYENSEFDGYTDEIKLYVEDVEKARRLRYALLESIGYCTENYQKPYPAQKEEIARWIMDNIKEVKVGDVTYKQNMGPVADGDFDKVRLMKTEIDSKGGTEEVFEFNLSDINPRSVTYAIKGDELAVEFETKYQDDIIKYYKDGEIQNYVSDVEIVFDDIETARNIKDGLITVTEELGAK